MLKSISIATLALSLASCALSLEGRRLGSDGVTERQLQMGQAVSWSTIEAKASLNCPSGIDILSQETTFTANVMWYRCKGDKPVAGLPKS